MKTLKTLRRAVREADRSMQFATERVRKAALKMRAARDVAREVLAAERIDAALNAELETFEKEAWAAFQAAHAPMWALRHLKNLIDPED